MRRLSEADCSLLGPDRWGGAGSVWDIADLEYRVVVDREGRSLRLRGFVADGRLGPAMPAYGGLSLALDPVGDRAGWPEGGRLGTDHTAVVRSLCRDVLSFAANRRELALLMMSHQEVRRGGTVAWLPDGGWPGRAAQALVIAVDLDDPPLAIMIRGLITAQPTRIISRRPRHLPDVTQAERDRLDALHLDRGDLEQDVEQQARYWLAQYSKVLGRTMDL